LRVLSDGFYYRVGGHQPIKSDVRVIAATHQNLEERVRQGSFREDLYHRLNVIRLRLPPLRERREDIQLLARHFLAKSARELGVEAKRLSPEALQFIQGLSLPGNVRQLENLCHWLTVLAPAQVVMVDDLPLEIRTDASNGNSLQPRSLPAAPAASVAAVAAAPATATAAAPMAAEDWLQLLVREVDRQLVGLCHGGDDPLGRVAPALLCHVGLVRLPQPGNAKFSFHLSRFLLQLHSFPSPRAD
jgi:two-component system nitrogen regulation response regulator GlnG